MPASRTSEGEPTRCAVCDAEHQVDLSAIGCDAPCLACGCLLRRGQEQADRLRDRLSEAFGVPAAAVTPQTLIAEIADDSLTRVELVMELEEELDEQGIDTRLSDEEAQCVRTVGDALRLLLDRRRAAGLD